jgi:hypothetical protein
VKPRTRPVRLKYPMPANAGPFAGDTDPEDSERLRRLREIIDTEIGWANQADEEAGDYEARLHEVALELKRLRARDLSMREWLRTLLVKVDALLNGRRRPTSTRLPGGRERRPSVADPLEIDHTAARKFAKRVIAAAKRPEAVNLARAYLAMDLALKEEQANG